jgi:hypothetical protein
MCIVQKRLLVPMFQFYQIYMYAYMHVAILYFYVLSKIEISLNVLLNLMNPYHFILPTTHVLEQKKVLRTCRFVCFHDSTVKNTAKLAKLAPVKFGHLSFFGHIVFVNLKNITTDPKLIFSGNLKWGDLWNKELMACPTGVLISQVSLY